MMTAGITVSSLLVILGIWAHSFTLIPGLFKLNKECQEEGYYMAEFEFKMLGFAYYLDKGQYVKSVSGIRGLHRQLKSRQGLVKLPEFSDKIAEMDFYLNLQNPRTGAFMDDAFPYCTYNECTENVLAHLDALAKETGRPLRLKYPLKYLDEINTPEKLTAFLDDVSNVGWIASKLPQTTYVFARSLLSYCNGEGVMERNGLYRFSPEWKAALLKWFYESQDPVTGFWGPRSVGNGRLLKADLTNTASIIKMFVDRNGDDIRPSFPLRNKKEMFTTALQVMSEPQPADDDLDEWHEWALKMGKGSYLLTRYLWKDASTENKAGARKLIENYLRTRFEKYYVPSEGAFGYYPGSLHATLDGTGGAMGDLEDAGAFSSEKQGKLWGGLAENCMDLGSIEDFNAINGCREVNSVRFYSGTPDTGDYTAEAVLVFYPKAASVMDIMELVPKVKNWIDTTSQSMGNWTSKQDILVKLAGINMKPVPVFRDKLPVEQLDGMLKENQTLTVMGFDVLQVPRCRAVYRPVSPGQGR